MAFLRIQKILGFMAWGLDLRQKIMCVEPFLVLRVASAQAHGHLMHINSSLNSLPISSEYLPKVSYIFLQVSPEFLNLVRLTYGFRA